MQVSPEIVTPKGRTTKGIVKMPRESRVPNWFVLKISPWSVAATVSRLVGFGRDRGLKVFSVIDHRKEALDVGLELRETRVVILGSAKAGTPVMDAFPLAALDLPLKVLVWSDGEGTKLGYAATGELGRRFGVDGMLSERLTGIDGLTDDVISTMDLRPDVPGKARCA
jgi:uncharacterized protein (DUF302 family)